MKKYVFAIEKWVKSGGVIIGEAYFAGWNAEHGHHEKIVPGYGLHKVFKVRQGVVEPAEKNVVNKIEIEKSVLSTKSNKKINNITGKDSFIFDNNSIDSLSKSQVEIQLLKNLPYIKKGEKVFGTIVKGNVHK